MKNNKCHSSIYALTYFGQAKNDVGQVKLINLPGMVIKFWNLGLEKKIVCFL